VKKVVVVMAYYDRVRQLKNTLRTINNSTYSSVEIVLLDDASPEPLELSGITCKYPVSILYTQPEEKFWTSCPVIPLNRGFQRALDVGADIVVIQNPENFHVGDCLSHVAEHANDADYTVYSCFSCNKELSEVADVVGKFPGEELNHPYAISASGDTGWYHHGGLRPCYLEFFAAVTRKNLLLLNGYDERYAPGRAYGDSDLIRRVRKLGLNCVTPIGPFVVHQWHPSTPPPNGHELEYRNRDLYLSLKDGDYTAAHTHTPDLKG
jgi:GT2 family glycosyltransferase